MLDIKKIRAISFDLDDTLWPIWPTIERAEARLLQWLAEHAPRTAALCAQPEALREIRMSMNTLRPDLLHDMSALRRESIRLALTRAGDDSALAEPAFDVFFAARQDVIFYDDALPALELLSKRFPMAAISNGNADVQRVGLGRYFPHAFSAHVLGVAKPDVRIFHAASNALRMQPNEVLHVGDDAHLDVVGALGAGMQTVWLNRDAEAWVHGVPSPHLVVGNLLELCEALSE